MEHSRSLGPMGLLLPAVNYANIQNVTAGMVYGPRTIPDYQLVYVVSGAHGFVYRLRCIRDTSR
jgi:hypothetical protein